MNFQIVNTRDSLAHARGKDSTIRDYRYGYQGSEKDDEVKGKGNSYTTMFRQYDPRVGRWLSLDPAKGKYPSASPYSYAVNSPLLIGDPGGDTLYVYGSAEEFTKYKAMIEKEYSGLVEVNRDENSMVTMTIRYDKISPNGNAQDEILRIKNSEAYKFYEMVLSDENNTSMELVEGEDTKLVQGGNFRGATIYGPNAICQTIDMGDMEDFDKSPKIIGLSMIMHETYEAFNDQVKGGSPEIRTNSQWTSTFTPLHNDALELQAQINGVVKQMNYLLRPGDLGATNQEFMFLTKYTDDFGETKWEATTYDVVDGNFTNMRTYDAEVTEDSGGNITGVNIKRE